MVYGSGLTGWVSSGYHFAPSPRLQPPHTHTHKEGLCTPARRTQEVKEGLLACCPTGSVLLAHGHLCPTPLLVKAS